MNDALIYSRLCFFANALVMCPPEDAQELLAFFITTQCEADTDSLVIEVSTKMATAIANGEGVDYPTWQHRVEAIVDHLTVENSTISKFAAQCFRFALRAYPQGLLK